MKSLTVYQQGTRLHVLEGARNGETILFLHPQGGTSSIWNDMLPYFSEDFHIICMDLRGHGQSEHAATGYDIGTQCEDIRAVLDLTGVERAHLIGNSLGGDFATFFAATYPDRVRSLINLDSGMIDFVGPNGEREGSKADILEQYRKRAVPAFQHRKEFAPYARQHWYPWDPYYEKWFQHVTIYPLSVGLITYQIPTAINLQIMETVCDLHYEDAYAQMRCPVLFLPAETEPKLDVKLSLIQKVTRHPQSKTVVIPNSKHLMPIDTPLATSMEILAFLKGLVLDSPSG
ncbi:alpha/beta fold hydrolase [Brevibacillus formosus]|uniref:alpha/beta fold hydrolase n=1 Tax=Brevibacillus formosus TaxID=54913 RepID=UPI001C67DE9B|nr:alpha/beta hydrolase [Brevibacillus formosus]MBW5470195.1 alpha/beta fold hydrolase [Brevibacillus formosus]